MHPSEAPRLKDGRHLRYVLTVALLDAGAPRTIAELVQAARDAGCTFRGPEHKVVSDSLRWEMAHGRVTRVARGIYRVGSMPRSTEWWLRARLADHARRPTLAELIELTNVHGEQRGEEHALPRAARRFESGRLLGPADPLAIRDILPDRARGA